MTTDQTLKGLLAYLKAHWPTYLTIFGGGGLAALALIAWGAGDERWSLVFFGLALLLILAYFLTTSLWAAYEQHVRRHSSPSHTIFEMGRV